MYKFIVTLYNIEKNEKIEAEVTALTYLSAMEAMFEKVSAQEAEWAKTIGEVCAECLGRIK